MKHYFPPNVTLFPLEKFLSSLFMGKMKWNFLHFATISSDFFQSSQCLKITVKVLFNIVSEAKFIKNGEFGEF